MLPPFPASDRGRNPLFRPYDMGFKDSWSFAIIANLHHIKESVSFMQECFEAQLGRPVPVRTLCLPSCHLAVLLLRLFVCGCFIVVWIFLVAVVVVVVVQVNGATLRRFVCCGAFGVELSLTSEQRISLSFG